ncbi:MAG: ABC transporter permease [Nitrosomonas sp.]|nr:ABC transporter permease [Nitrosomonas sp.]
MTGFITLFQKEISRFLKVSLQTILAPIIATLLYLLIFFHVLSAHVEVYPGIAYTQFLIPGLVMMAIVQNAFANSSSSLIQSKMSGNIVFVLLSPLSYHEIFFAYILASVVRGLLVGSGVYLITLFFFEIPLHFPIWAILFAIISSALLGALGLLAGISAEKVDQLAAFQNFIILPLTLLSGVFYTIHSLPVIWQHFSEFNPFFYAIDGFRYGFLGVSEVSPYKSLMVVTIWFLAISLLTIKIIKSGYKLRN